MFTNEKGNRTSKRLRRALSFGGQKLAYENPSRKEYLGKKIAWDLFNLQTFLPYRKLKGFYALTCGAIFSIIISMILFYLSQTWASNNTTQIYLEGIALWKQSDSSEVSDVSMYVMFQQETNPVYPQNTNEALAHSVYMNYYYDGYKVDYPESFLVYGKTDSLFASEYSSDGTIFVFSSSSPKLNETSPSVCYSFNFNLNGKREEVAGFPACTEKQDSNTVSIWQRVVIQMDGLCMGRSHFDCKNLCEMQLGVLVLSDGAKICVNYYILAVVCLAFDFSSSIPVFMQGCFSNQAITYYIQAYPEQLYGLNYTMWMARDINDPYVIAYELSKNLGEPITISSTSVTSSIASAFLLSATLLVIVLTFGYFLILVVNEGIMIKQKVWRAGGSFVDIPILNDND